MDSLFGGQASAETDALFGAGFGPGGFPAPPMSGGMPFSAQPAPSLPFGSSIAPPQPFGAPAANLAMPFGAAAGPPPAGVSAPPQPALPFGAPANMPATGAEPALPFAPAGVPLPPPAVAFPPPPMVGGAGFFPPCSPAAPVGGAVPFSIPAMPAMPAMQFPPLQLGSDPGVGVAAPVSQFPAPSVSPGSFNAPFAVQAPPAEVPTPSPTPMQTQTPFGGAAPVAQTAQVPFGQASPAPFVAAPPQAPFGAPSVTTPQVAFFQAPPAAFTVSPPQSPFGAAPMGFTAPQAPSGEAPPAVSTEPPPQVPFGGSPAQEPSDQAPPAASALVTPQVPFGAAPAQAPFGQAPSPTVSPPQMPFGAAPPAQVPFGQAPPTAFSAMPPSMPFGAAPSDSTMLPNVPSPPMAVQAPFGQPPSAASTTTPSQMPFGAAPVPAGVLPPAPQMATPPGVLPPAPMQFTPPPSSAPVSAFPGAAAAPATSPSPPGARPPCAVMAFGFGGKLVCGGPGGLKEKSVKTILQNSVKGLDDIEAFPGPYGRVDSYVTSSASEYLGKLGAQLTDPSCQTSEHLLLHLAGHAKHSAALLCGMLACMLDTGGKVESNAFWDAFLPRLAERGLAMCPVTSQPSPLQQFCRRLANGDAAGALGDADPSLWHHALIVAPLAAPEAYNKILSGITATLLKPGNGDSAPTADHRLSEAERSDPLVKALLFMYDAIGKQTMPEIPDEVLDSWPAYAALFCGVLRASSDWGLAMNFIAALGQRLIVRGDAFGAHLCYLLTGRTLESIDKPDSLVCLLGIDHREPKNFGSLLEPLAMQLSEIYEYALRCGDENALCTSLQPFKLVHARVLADLGMEEKASRYAVMIQAFVKAVPQNRLSEAFRMSMRDFHDQLNPIQANAEAQKPSINAKQALGSMFGVFRGVAQATGLATRPMAPPALGDDGEDSQPPMQTSSAPGNFAPPPGAFAPQTGGFVPVQMPAPTPMPSAAPYTPAVGGSFAPAPPLAPMPSQAFGSAPAMPPGPNPIPGLSSPSGGMYPAATAYPNYPAAMPLLGGSGSMGGDGSEGEAAPPPPTPDQRMNQAMGEDPLLGAVKGVFGFGKSMFSKISGKEAEPNGSTDSAANDFFYDEVQKRWRQRGQENEPSADAYDPMTGKLKPKPVTAPPPMGGPPMGGPPMGGPPMGGPPMGGPPMGGPPMSGSPNGASPPSALNSLMAPPAAPRFGQGGSAMGSLYLNPLANPSSPAPNGAPGGMGAPPAGPLSSPFGAPPPGGLPGAVRSSPFG